MRPWPVRPCCDPCLVDIPPRQALSALCQLLSLRECLPAACFPCAPVRALCRNLLAVRPCPAADGAAQLSLSGRLWAGRGSNATRTLWDADQGQRAIVHLMASKRSEAWAALRPSLALARAAASAYEVHVTARGLWIRTGPRSKTYMCFAGQLHDAHAQLRAADVQAAVAQLARLPQAKPLQILAPSAGTLVDADGRTDSRTDSRAARQTHRAQAKASRRRSADALMPCIQAVKLDAGTRPPFERHCVPCTTAKHATAPHVTGTTRIRATASSCGWFNLTAVYPYGGCGGSQSFCVARIMRGTGNGIGTGTGGTPRTAHEKQGRHYLS